MSLILAATWGIASACVTLALIHLRIWWNDRSAWANVAFALIATGVALFGLAELAMARADTPERYGAVLRWAHVPIFMMVVGVAWFVGTSFHAGRRVLAYAACGVNLLTLIVNFVRPPNADYWVVTGMTQVRFLGELVWVPVGETSAWHWVTQLSFALLLAFVADATKALWHSGESATRRRALSFCIGFFVFVAIASGQAALIFAGILRTPHLVAMSFFPVLLVMGHDLSGQLLRAAGLARHLQASETSLREGERQMRIAAAEAQRLSGRLIDAQEEERRRIARELHDDLSQRLAVMSVQLDLLRRAHAGAAADATIGRIVSEVRELASEVHALSHALHPAKLGQLGLGTAARAWCRDLAAQSSPEIDFQAEAIPVDLDPGVALCVYRLVQETTRNIVRHSRAASATVTVRVEADTLRLVVEDTGCGFDPEATRETAGLGLVSMRERVRSLGGTLSILSRTGHGTRVEATLPMRRALPGPGVEGPDEEVVHARR
jgi:signal transduction histidine kinase